MNKYLLKTAKDEERIISAIKNLKITPENTERLLSLKAEIVKLNNQEFSFTKEWKKITEWLCPCHLPDNAPAAYRAHLWNSNSKTLDMEDREKALFRYVCNVLNVIRKKLEETKEE